MARSEADLLARRIESQAMISAVPGQLADLEQIAREVRALGEELEQEVEYAIVEHHPVNEQHIGIVTSDRELALTSLSDPDVVQVLQRQVGPWGPLDEEA